MHFRIDRLARDGVWLAVVAAISVAVVSAAMGPARQSQFGGHDVPFAIATLSALWQGWDFAPGLPPGWLMPMVCGFGAPVLYFYPPGGFLFGAAWLAVGDLSSAAALSVASLVARLAGMLFCFLWLRRLCSGHAALLGAAAALKAVLGAHYEYRLNVVGNRCASLVFLFCFCSARLCPYARIHERPP